MRAVARLFGYDITKNNVAPGDLLRMVSGHHLIITDTYHLCVNAWNLGIPAICIGSGARAQETSISDKKKEILFEMYGARKFYIFAESLRSFSGFFAEATRAINVVSNKPLIDRVIENIDAHRNMALERLRDSVDKMLQN
jgi:hypothetical protein